MVSFVVELETRSLRRVCLLHGQRRMTLSLLSLFAQKVTRKEIPVLKIAINKIFNKYLLLMNIGISGALSFTGDTILQHYEVMRKEDREWDGKRSLKMTTSGITVGFVCHYWYLFLDKHFPGRTIKTVMKKVIIDQFVCSPLYITVFFATACYMEGKNFREFRNEVICKGWQLFLADGIVWPPAQIINFYYISPQFRVLYDNIISLGCDVYTSYVKNEVPIKSSENND